MSDASQTSRLSIGAVSEATEIPTATLRTWERRYGFPDPERTESGHRRYHPDVVEQLRLTARAVDAGHRPSDVVGLSNEALEDLLAETEGSDPPPISGDDAEDWLQETLRAAVNFDADALERLFRRGWDESGALAFVTERAAPFLDRLGEAWAAGLASVAAEHVASHKLGQFLSQHWRNSTLGGSGPTALLAAPEHELHEGGLHMAAVVFSLAGWEVLFLGGNTPTETLLDTIRDATPSAVGLSLARSYDEKMGRETLETLRDDLPGDIPLIVGGCGAPSDVEGVSKIDDLSKLYEWAKERA